MLYNAPFSPLGIPVKRVYYLAALLLAIIAVLAIYPKSHKLHKAKRALCVADNKIFSAYCLKAAREEAEFQTFRRSPIFNLLYDHNTFEEGLEYFRAISTAAPDLLDRVDMLHTSDATGGPQLFEYGTAGLVSPSTLRYMYVASQLRELFGDLDGCRVIEIGGGYGGQCKILCELFKIKEYTIVDLPECLELTRRYLQAQGIENVVLRKYGDIPNVLQKRVRYMPVDAHYDLVISNYSFSESDRALQKQFLQKIIRRSNAGYLVCSTVPRHFQVEPLEREEMIKKISGLGLHCQVVQEKPLTGKDNFIVTWKTSDRF